MLLIHGSGASGSTWSPMMPALTARHHVIRVDLPGCGQSPPAASYDVAVQAGRVAALLDDLGLRQVAVAGHSSGGYVATALAEGRPDLVRSLALVSTGPSLDALLPQPAILRLLLGPPFGPLLWSLRSDAAIRSGIRATTVRQVDIPDDLVAACTGHHVPRVPGGVPLQHRLHRRAERARTSRRPQGSVAGGLRRGGPPLGAVVGAPVRGGAGQQRRAAARGRAHTAARSAGGDQ